MKNREQKTTNPTAPQIPEYLGWWMSKSTGYIFDHFGNCARKASNPTKRHIYIDNGANVLAVAHLDTVQQLTGITSIKGDRITATGLDDRLGAFAIFHALPFKVDILLTDNEETGNSTAAHYKHHNGKNYLYCLEIDRCGTDAVTYDLDNPQWLELIAAHFGEVGFGSFTDLCYLKNLDCCMINVGTGYYDAHGKNSYAHLDELAAQIDNLEAFNAAVQEHMEDNPDSPLCTQDHVETYSHGYHGHGYQNRGYGQKSSHYTNGGSERALPAITPMESTDKELNDCINYCACCGGKLIPADGASYDWPFCQICTS